MTDAERRDRDRLELDVLEGVLAVHRTGLALQELHDRKLYRDENGFTSEKTWEKYCKARFNLTGRRCYQIIAMAETVDVVAVQMRTTGSDSPLPESERQTRELAGVEPEDRAAVWEAATAAAGGKQPTSRQVREAAAAAKIEAALSPEARAQLQDEREQQLRRDSEQRQEVEEDEAGAALGQKVLKHLRIALRWARKKGWSRTAAETAAALAAAEEEAALETPVAA